MTNRHSLNHNSSFSGINYNKSFTARKAPAHSTSTLINKDWVRWYGVPDEFIIQAETDGIVQHRVWDNEKLLNHISHQLDMEKESPLARGGSRYGRALLQRLSPEQTGNFLFALNQPKGALRRQDSIDNVSSKEYKHVLLLGHNTFLSFTDAAENYTHTKSVEEAISRPGYAEELPVGSRLDEEGNITFDLDLDAYGLAYPRMGLKNKAKEIKEHYAMGLNEALDTIKDAKDDQDAQKKLLSIRSSANYYEGESAWAHREGQNFIYALFQRAYTTDIARVPTLWYDYAAERAKVLTRGSWSNDEIEPGRMVISR
tara:strand:- start:431 stop:1372 length:942 start_codon:yes stop_codon:yes gene_type:complete